MWAKHWCLGWLKPAWYRVAGRTSWIVVFAIRSHRPLGREMTGIVLALKPWEAATVPTRMVQGIPFWSPFSVLSGAEVVQLGGRAG